MSFLTIPTVEAVAVFWSQEFCGPGTLQKDYDFDCVSLDHDYYLVVANQNATG